MNCLRFVGEKLPIIDLNGRIILYSRLGGRA
jgi:hypothetical protein